MTTPIGPGGAEPSRIRSEDRDSIESFEDLAIPFGELDSPIPTTPIKELVIQTINLEDLTVKTPENVATMKRIAQRADTLFKFAQKHPWLIATIGAALICLITASYFTVLAFTGHTTLALFHAHPEIGAGVVFMTAYYGVYLINLARRTMLKDTLEQRIHEGIDTKQTPTELIHKVQEEIFELDESQSKLLKELEEAKKGVQLPSLPDFGELKLPPIPILQLPQEPTKEMQVNQETARSIADKLGRLGKKLTTYVKENPTTTLFFIGGIAMTALGGVGCILWLHGSTSAFFFGQLSAMKILPLLMYGLCFIYEGYTSSAMGKIKKELARVEELARVNRQAQTALEEFRANLQEPRDRILEAKTLWNYLGSNAAKGAILLNS